MRPNQTCKESGCLLEKLAELAGCNYLSDLRCALFLSAIPFLCASADLGRGLFREGVERCRWVYPRDEDILFFSAGSLWFLLHALAESAGPDATS